MTKQTSDLRIDVYSDVVCPWCYIGKRRFERAVTSVGETVPVTWRPFQLNPTMPLQGMDRRTYLQAKFGGPEPVARMEQQIAAAGAEEQISFALKHIQRTPNTFAAHRLIWHAGRFGKQDAIVEALFHSFFVEGQDIGDLKTLAQVSAQAGLERTEAESFLMSEAGVAEVTAEEAAGHRLGIRGVPYFVINDRYAISGAQPPETFLSALERARGCREEKPLHGHS